MKKTILFATLLLCISTTINAQKKISFGVKGGAHILNISSDYFTQVKSETKLHFGVLAEFAISSTFSIQSEIIYSKSDVAGRRHGYGFGGISSISEHHLDYIHIPVLAKFYIYKNTSIELGPSFNFSVLDKFRTPSLPDVTMNNGTVYSQSRYYDAEAKSLEFSSAIGVSHKLKNGFFASARYNHGLSNATENDAKNNSYQLGIGFLF